MKVELYQDEAGEYRIRFRYANGEIAFDGYTRKDDAIRGYRTFCEEFGAVLTSGTVTLTINFTSSEAHVIVDPPLDVEDLTEA